MNKIRIGNDIRLNVVLKGNKDFDQASTKRLIPYFVNITASEFIEPVPMCNGCCRKRSHGYGPCPRKTCSCGPCGYHHCAHNLNYHGCNHHGWDHPCYGAGIYNWHHCHYRGRHRYGCGPLAPNYGYYPWSFGPHPYEDYHFLGYGKTHFFDKMSDFRYEAPYKILPEKNKIQVYFPAQRQFAQGDYKLIILVQDYEEGWGHHNIHTYTMDYGKVFRLTDEENAIDASVTIDMETDQIINKQDNELVEGWIGVLKVKPESSQYNHGDQSYELPDEDQDMVSGVDNVNLGDLEHKDNIVGQHEIDTKNGGHLWVFSDRKIASVQIGAFQVPMTKAAVSGGKYYYVSLNSVVPGTTLNPIILV